MAKVTTKEETLKAGKDAFGIPGAPFKAERYWEWRNEHKAYKVKHEELEGNKVKLTYPACSHEIIVGKTNIEMGKMMMSNYHYPTCPSCRRSSYKAACSERDKRRRGFEALGLVSVGDAFKS